MRKLGEAFADYVGVSGGDDGLFAAQKRGEESSSGAVELTKHVV